MGASLVVLAVTLALPFTPLADALGLTVMSMETAVILALVVVAYVITAEITKYLFYRVIASSS